MRNCKNCDKEFQAKGGSVYCSLECRAIAREKVSLAIAYRDWIFKSTGGVCWYCGKPLIPGDFAVEHQTPKSRGGTDASSNVVPSCIACNSAKGNKTVEEYREAKTSPRFTPYQLAFLERNGIKLPEKPVRHQFWAEKNP